MQCLSNDAHTRSGIDRASDLILPFDRPPAHPHYLPTWESLRCRGRIRTSQRVCLPFFTIQRAYPQTVA